MSKRGTSLGGIMLATAVAVALLAAYGAIDVKWPWESVDLASAETEITYDAPARIVEIEPIALDCRARVHAEVPVKGRKEHKVAGQVYRTDTVELNAVGDIDTCVDATQVDILEEVDGSYTVLVPGEAIEFVRPRVDAVATMDSVAFDKGLVGKFTDVFPWVSDSEGLTSAGYAFAQQVVGGSACMELAYEVTEGLIVDSYRDQALAEGIAPGQIDVRVLGEPDFTQNETVNDSLDDFEFDLDGEAECEVAPDDEGPDQDEPTEAPRETRAGIG